MGLVPRLPPPPFQDPLKAKVATFTIGSSYDITNTLTVNLLSFFVIYGWMFQICINLKQLLFSWRHRQRGNLLSPLNNSTKVPDSLEQQNSAYVDMCIEYHPWSHLRSPWTVSRVGRKVFENFRRAFSHDLTDCPKVSQDAVEFGVSAIDIQVRFAENVPTDIIHVVVLVL